MNTTNIFFQKKPSTVHPCRAKFPLYRELVSYLVKTKFVFVNLIKRQ